MLPSGGVPNVGHKFGWRYAVSFNLGRMACSQTLWGCPGPSAPLRKMSMRKRLVLAIVAIATGATASMAQVPPAQQTAPQAMASKPLTVDATVGELLSNAAAKAVLARQDRKSTV